MKTDADIYFEMDFGDGKGFRQIALSTLEELPEIFQQELTKILEQVADILLQDVRLEFEKVMRSRTREGGKSLRDVIISALERDVVSQGAVLDMGVFSLQTAIKGSTGPEWGTNDRSLFEMLEEGTHPKWVDDPKTAYGYCSLAFAQALAEDAALMLEDETARMKFKAKVSKVFAGRSGEGIMVKCSETLFFDVPQFGTAFEHGILPHPGWEGWHVLDMVNGPGKAKTAAQDGAENWMLTFLDKAMANAVARLQTI